MNTAVKFRQLIAGGNLSAIGAGWLSGLFGLVHGRHMVSSTAACMLLYDRGSTETFSLEDLSTSKVIQRHNATVTTNRMVEVHQTIVFSVAFHARTSKRNPKKRIF